MNTVSHSSYSSGRETPAPSSGPGRQFANDPPAEEESSYAPTEVATDSEVEDDGGDIGYFSGFTSDGLRRPLRLTGLRRTLSNLSALTQVSEDDEQKNSDDSGGNTSPSVTPIVDGDAVAADSSSLHNQNIDISSTPAQTSSSPSGHPPSSPDQPVPTVTPLSFDQHAPSFPPLDVIDMSYADHGSPPLEEYVDQNSSVIGSVSFEGYADQNSHPTGPPPYQEYVDQNLCLSNFSSSSSFPFAQTPPAFGNFHGMDDYTFGTNQMTFAEYSPPYFCPVIEAPRALGMGPADVYKTVRGWHEDLNSLGFTLGIHTYLVLSPMATSPPPSFIPPSPDDPVLTQMAEILLKISAITQMFGYYAHLECPLPEETCSLPDTGASSNFLASPESSPPSSPVYLSDTWEHVHCDAQNDYFSRQRAARPYDSGRRSNTYENRSNDPFLDSVDISRRLSPPPSRRHVDTPRKKFSSFSDRLSRFLNSSIGSLCRRRKNHK